MSDKLKEIINSMQNIVNDLIKKAPDQVNKVKKNVSTTIDSKKIKENVNKVVDNIKSKAPDQIENIKKTVSKIDSKNVTENIKQFFANLMQKSPIKTKESEKKVDDKKTDHKIKSDLTDQDKKGVKKYSLPVSSTSDRSKTTATSGLTESSGKQEVSKTTGKLTTDGTKIGTPPVSGAAGTIEREAPTASRPMKFPYTFSAKIAQFPYRFYYNNNWIFRYYCYAIILCIPVFYKLERMSKSEGNVQKWAEIRRKEAEEIHYHN